MSDSAEPGVIGQTFGNYRIVAELGSGGMGRVYRAQHLHLDREVALKLLHAHLAADAGFRARFQREARSVSLLDHPNIVRLYDYGEQGGTLYLIMELLTDGSLRTLLRSRGTANGAQAQGQTFDQELELVRQAADALAFAHERSMVHRDIKPDNLLIKVETHTGGVQQMQLKVADFGLAHLAEEVSLTASGAAMGTPAYMSPEQCQGRDVDARSDIYALGVVLYELAVGRQPFAARSLSDAIYNHVYVAPPTPRSLRPDLPAEVEAIILRCLAKRPEDRYPSMTELASDLRGVIDRSALANIPLVMLEGDAAEDEALVSTPPPASEPDSVPVAHTPLTPAGGVQIPRLYVLGADGAVQQVVDLTGKGLTIGRLDTNDVVLNEPGVSRHHLMIDWNGTEATVTDLGSSNGTLLGGVQLPPQVPRVWNVTDELRIGPLQLRLARPVSHAALEADTAPAAASIPAAPVAAIAGMGAAGSGVAAAPLAATLDGAPSAVLAPSGTGAATAGSATTGDRGSATRLVVLALIVVLIGAGAFLLTRGGDEGSAPGIAAGTATATSGAASAAPTTATGNPAGSDPTATSGSAPVAAATTTDNQPTGGTTPQAATTPGTTAPAAQSGPVPTPMVATIADANEQSTVLTFDATTGQRVLLEITEITVGPTTGYGGRASIVAANGVEIARTSLWANEAQALIDTTTIPAAGAYSVVVQLEEGVSFSGRLTLHSVPPDAAGSVTPGGEAVTMTTTSPGQLARLSFDATSGQRVFVDVTNVQMGPSGGYAGTLTIQGENNSVLSSRSLWVQEPITYIDTIAIAASGTYSLVLDPDKLVTGSVTVRVLDVPPDVTGSTTVGGAPVSIATASPGQNASVTFQGSANQSITIDVRDILVGPTSGYGGVLILLDSAGNEITRKSLWANESVATAENMVLPTAGDYTIVIDPDGTSVFSGTVSVRAGA
jgi:serine/threonine protein kinase